MEKFNNANGVVQRAVMAKKAMGRRSGGGRNIGVDGMVRGGGSRFSRRDQMASSSQEVAMMRMKNWADRDAPSVVYGEEEGSCDSYVGRNDRGGSSYSRRSRSRGRGRYQSAYSDEGDGDDGYEEDGSIMTKMSTVYDVQSGRDDGQDDGRRDRYRRDVDDDSGRKYKSTPRESIDEDDHSHSQSQK